MTLVTDMPPGRPGPAVVGTPDASQISTTCPALIDRLWPDGERLHYANVVSVPSALENDGGRRNGKAKTNRRKKNNKSADEITAVKRIRSCGGVDLGDRQRRGGKTLAHGNGDRSRPRRNSTSGCRKGARGSLRQSASYW